MRVHETTVRTRLAVPSVAVAAAMLIATLPAAGQSGADRSIHLDARSAEIVLVEGAFGGSPSLADELERIDAEVLARLSANRWLVAGSAERLADLPGMSAVSPWTQTDGIEPALRTAAKGTGRVGVAIGLAPGVDVADVADELRGSGVIVGWTAPTARPVAQLGLMVERETVAVLVDRLETIPGLVWAQLQPPIRLLNGASVWLCQSGVEDATPIFDRGLHGEGQIIGIVDTGLDIDECRFEDPEIGLPALNDAEGIDVNPDHRKVLAVDFHWSEDWPPGPFDWDEHGHGTHVAGSAAGDELGNGRFDGSDGMAPAAKLVIQDGGVRTDDCADLPGLGCPVRPLEPVLEQAWEQGARIHTNSWGDEENLLPFGRYTERTADVDRFVWNHKEMLVLFATGNSGPGVDSVISPSTGKNVVAVGATAHGSEPAPCVAGFSSRGWTADGRIKPDVLAPGSWVTSAATNAVVPNPSCNDALSSGTSMAAPTAAGLAALVRQYFVDGFHPSGSARSEDGFEPTAALVKAMLIASAVDLSTRGCPHEPAPSRSQGWGLIQLDTALVFTGSDVGMVVDDHREGFASAADEPYRMSVAVTSPGPLEVVLVWSDAPSTSLADTNLLNDLDLTVSGPDGVYGGNSFADGVSVTGGEPDRINNVEVVRLPDAGRGIWTIEVAPHAIPVPEQDFALVVTGPVQSVESPRQTGGRVSP
jgi:subtilisin family serine protease